MIAKKIFLAGLFMGVSGLALAGKPVLCSPGYQDSTCGAQAHVLPQAAPNCPAGQNQTTPPVWQGSRWSAPGCQLPPPPPPPPPPNPLGAVTGTLYQGIQFDGAVVYGYQNVSNWAAIGTCYQHGFVVAQQITINTVFRKYISAARRYNTFPTYSTVPGTYLITAPAGVGRGGLYFSNLATGSNNIYSGFVLRNGSGAVLSSGNYNGGPYANSTPAEDLLVWTGGSPVSWNSSLYQQLICQPFAP